MTGDGRCVNGPKVDPAATEMKIEAPMPHEEQFNKMYELRGKWLKLDTFYC